MMWWIVQMYLCLFLATSWFVTTVYSNQIYHDNGIQSPMTFLTQKLIVHKRSAKFRSRLSPPYLGGYRYDEYSDYDYKPKLDGGPYADEQASYLPSLASKHAYFGENQSVLSGIPLGQSYKQTILTGISDRSLPLESSGLEVMSNWPDPAKKLGQLSAVSLDVNGNVVVFHRGDRVWSDQTFRQDNVYNQQYLGAIQQNTVVVFDSVSGQVLQEWGNNLFYMPHGLTVDNDNNVWLTDVALHQVFKFPAGKGDNKPVLSLGVRFEPGNDDSHFCKPAAVAVLSTGDFFVADGYCNTRVIKYGRNGQKLIQWGQRFNTFYGVQLSHPPPYAFAVPHGLALAEEKGLIFVADRENGRIQGFSTDNGTFTCEIHFPLFGSRLFSVAYSPSQGGLLYAVNGPDMSGILIQGFIINLTSKELQSVFSPNGTGFANPHDLSVSEDGSQVYVVELNPFKVWKFAKETSTSAVNNVSNSKPGELHQVIAEGRKPDYHISSNPGLPLEKSYNVKNSTHMQVDISVSAAEKTNEGRSMSFAVGEILAILAFVVIVLAAVIISILRIKKRGTLCGYSLHSRRWDFHNTSSDGFKFGQLLDPHSGFEKVCTEESDDDERGSIHSEELEHITSRIQHA